MNNAVDVLGEQVAASADAVLVIDDHPLVRLGVKIWVSTLSDSGRGAIRLLEASSLEEGLMIFRAQSSAIGLVLLDLQLPDAHGLTGIQTFLRQCPGANVAVLSGSSDPALIQQLHKHGAVGYIQKASGFDEFDKCIRALGLWQHGPGDATEPGALSQESLQSGRTVKLQNGASVVLTARQSEILDWVLTGLSNREIADRVFLSEGTVKNHVSSLLLMFGTRSRANLISLLR